MFGKAREVTRWIYAFYFCMFVLSIVGFQKRKMDRFVLCSNQIKHSVVGAAAVCYYAGIVLLIDQVLYHYALV
jgi:hypothetical protein